MLKIHQRMGLITTVPLIVSVVTSLNAGGQERNFGNARPARCTRLADRRSIRNYVSHPLHQTDGVSHAARGKGICHQGQCEFLIAVPVKSFDSGDSNRDLRMIQVTRGAEFAMVTVCTRLPESASTSRRSGPISKFSLLATRRITARGPSK
jgi:hypothetical protein